MTIKDIKRAAELSKLNKWHVTLKTEDLECLLAAYDENEKLRHWICGQHEQELRQLRAECEKLRRGFNQQKGESL